METKLCTNKSTSAEQSFEAVNRQFLKPLSVLDFLLTWKQGLIFSCMSLAIISITKILIIVEKKNTGR